MRIGVLTFHFPDNFGAVLQAYALQKYLEDRNHEVSIINYVPESVFKSYFFVKSLKFRHCVGNVLRLFLFPFYLYRKHLFYLFRKKYLNLSSLYKEKIETSYYDVLLTGSDQTFNLNYPFV